MQTNPCSPPTWACIHSVLPFLGNTLNKQLSYHTSSEPGYHAMHIAQLHNGDAVTQHFNNIRISVQTHNNCSKIASLELYPSDKFWSGVENPVFVWELLEEAARAAGIVTSGEPMHKLSKEVSPFTNPTAPSTLTAILTNIKLSTGEWMYTQDGGQF